MIQAFAPGSRVVRLAHDQGPILMVRVPFSLSSDPPNARSRSTNLFQWSPYSACRIMLQTAPSFNGRTSASGAEYRGSNPWGAAKLKPVFMHVSPLSYVHVSVSAKL